MNVYKEIMKTIKGNRDDVYYIHYSCQSLSDDNEGYSPRITSIAVLHEKSSQMFSFSIHLVAEKLRISRDEIFQKYEEIELRMLNEFFEFVNERIHNAVWIHWNMSNINYGFEALEHRYEVLSNQKCVHVNEKNKYNLSNVLKLRFGSNYAKNPKMKSLMEINKLLHRDFLNGEEEVTAFKAKEFIKLHKSTMSKVYFFQEVFQRINTNGLKTDTNQFRYKVNELYQNPIVQILGIIGVVGTIASLILSGF